VVRFDSDTDLWRMQQGQQCSSSRAAAGSGEEEGGSFSLGVSRSMGRRRQRQHLPVFTALLSLLLVLLGLCGAALGAAAGAGAAVRAGGGGGGGGSRRGGGALLAWGGGKGGRAEQQQQQQQEGESLVGGVKGLPLLGRRRWQRWGRVGGEVEVGGAASLGEVRGM
jgi:hypothetical protein